MLTSLAFLSVLNLLVATSSAPQECVLQPTHGTPLLLGDVEKQTIELTGNGWCYGVNATLLINGTDNSKRFHVNVKDNTETKYLNKNGGGKKRRHRKHEHFTMKTSSTLSTTLDANRSSSSSWNLFSDDLVATAGGQATARLVIESLPVQVSSTTTVIYNDYPLLTVLAASNAKPPGVATISSDTTLSNTAFISLPNMGSVATWSATSDDANVTIAPTSGSAGPNRTDIVLRSQQIINFTVQQASANPVMATLKATRASKETFSLRVKLADSAENSSLPLNIADIVHVKCQKDVRQSHHVIINNDELAAVSNSVISNNLCTIVISEDAISRALAKRHGIDATHEKCKRRKNTPRCKEIGAGDGEFITLLESADREKLTKLTKLYGRQRLTIFVYSDDSKREASRQSIFISADLKGRRSIPINFGGEKPDRNKPFHVEIAGQPVASKGQLSELKDYPERTYRATLRPKGAFGITHWSGSLGSKSLRVFATIPVDFASVRFPAAGLDLKSSSDTSAAQFTSLTTGLLLTVEPWDYRRSTNMFAIPFRFQGGLLMSNWYKGVFHPSTYLGGAVTLPLLRGTKQLDIDLALGLGWEVDLRNGYDSFGQRNHLLLTLGMNVLSLFGPQSAPK